MGLPCGCGHPVAWLYLVEGGLGHVGELHDCIELVIDV